MKHGSAPCWLLKPRSSSRGAGVPLKHTQPRRHCPGSSCRTRLLSQPLASQRAIPSPRKGGRAQPSCGVSRWPPTPHGPQNPQKGTGTFGASRSLCPGAAAGFNPSLPAATWALLVPPGARGAEVEQNGDTWSSPAPQRCRAVVAVPPPLSGSGCPGTAAGAGTLLAAPPAAPIRAAAAARERWRGLSAASSRRRLPLREGAGLGEGGAAAVQRRRAASSSRSPGPRAAARPAPPPPPASLLLRAGPVGSPRCQAGHGDSAPASPSLSSSPCRRRSCRRLLLLLPAELLMARTSGGQARLPLHQPQRGEPAGARAAPAPRTVRAARQTMGPGGSGGGWRPPRRAPRPGLRGERWDPPAGRPGRAAAGSSERRPRHRRPLSGR